MKLHTVGIIAKPKKREIQTVVPPLLAWLAQHNIQAILDEETAQCLARDDGHPRQQIPPKVDLLIVFGGDGTLLASGRLLQDQQIPILAINLGKLGFLTEITLEELYPVLEDVLADRHNLDSRYLLEAFVVRNQKRTAHYTAINDIVLHKTALARIIDFKLSLNGRFASTIRSDGLILASPTGSTAYSLSAGGPVLLPTVEAMIVTPIAPHMLNSRPLVIPSDARVEVEFDYREEPIYLTADGQVGEELHVGDSVTIQKSRYAADIIQSPHHDFFEILRTKLRWGQR